MRTRTTADASNRSDETEALLTVAANLFEIAEGLGMGHGENVSVAIFQGLHAVANALIGANSNDGLYDVARSLEGVAGAIDRVASAIATPGAATRGDGGHDDAGYG